MRKFTSCVLLLLLFGVASPAFAHSDLTTHEIAQKNAQKQQKQRDKQYRRLLKKQDKAMKKQRKQAAKDAERLQGYH